jgi:prepilin-type N-terminal cleavage/methylation domain-containing protein
MRQITRRAGAPTRGGFTLVEMMVVLTIILILVGLAVGGIMKALNLQQRRNTESEVSKLDQAFMRHWKAVLDQSRTEQPNPIALRLAGADPSYPNNPLGDALAPNRAKVIHTLMCLRREFPVSFKEATTPIVWGPTPALPPLQFPPGQFQGFDVNRAYFNALTNVNVSAASQGRPPEDQSSACLYLILKQRRAGVEFDPDTSLSAQEVVDLYNDGIKEIYDGWQRVPNTSQPLVQIPPPGQAPAASGNYSYPIIFNRWAANSGGNRPFYYGEAELNTGGAQPFNPSSPADQEDPEALLSSPVWQAWLQQLPQQQQGFLGVFQQIGYPAAPQQNNRQYQYKLTPVIMSLGSNGKYDQGAPGADDIINFQLR